MDLPRKLAGELKIRCQGEHFLAEPLYKQSICPKAGAQSRAAQPSPRDGDFVGQAEVAGAIPVVEEYLEKAIMTGGVAERMPGVESLILKEGWVFDGGGFD